MKKTDYETAYRAAVPNPSLYVEAAISALVSEANPDEWIHTQTMRNDIATGRMPEVMARAEHLSRQAQAIEAVEGPKQILEVERRRIARDTCPVCREEQGDIAARVPHSLQRHHNGAAVLVSCLACYVVADDMYTEWATTAKRKSAVSRALSEIIATL